MIGSARSHIALGERQSAAVMQLGIHTCFETALVPYPEPAMRAEQKGGPRALVCADPETGRAWMPTATRRPSAEAPTPRAKRD